MRRRPIARMAVRTTVVAGTAVAVGAHVANKSNAQGAQQAQDAAAAAPAPAPVAPAQPDTVAQLTQLAALKDSGALTEAEFEAEKAKILG